MKRIWTIIAAAVSVLALALAVDPGHFAFSYVDAGGHKLRSLMRGEGNPTVIFENGGSPGAGGGLEMWQKVQPDVSRFARTISYDRAGSALSEPGPNPRDAKQVALELHTMLMNANVSPPYLLVGHSFGGPLLRVFAGMYPQDVCGMLLVDPTQEEAVEWDQARHPKRAKREDEEWKEIDASMKEAHESHVPPGIPVVVITAMGPKVLPDWVAEKDRREFHESRPVWLQSHTDWVNKIPNARHIITENSGHVVPFEEPELIIKTLRDMVEEIKSRGPSQNGTAVKH